jgi:formyltetrahydrofolate dehydrogenase
MEANDMTLKFPNQLFINNEFIDASNKATFDTINPTNEEVTEISSYSFIA